MRLTRAADYAIRCVLYLARQGQGVLTSRQEVARQTDIPAHFLAKIARDLARVGLIEIRQGAKGGFVLSRDPATISLLEVVETMIGEIQLNDCIGRPSGCKARYHCAVHRVWLDARDQLRSTLRQVNFERLSADACLLPAYADVLLDAEGLETTTSAPAEWQ